MKQYNRLLRIKYKEKLFDIFSDGDHHKVFLEVRIIDGKENYFYIEINDYIHLNRIYNCKNLDVLYSISSLNNKFMFQFKVYIATIGITLLSPLIYEGLYLSKLLPNSMLVKNSKMIMAFDESFPGCDVISDNSELDKYFVDSVSFNDLRDTLEENQNINEHYREYCYRFIEALEKSLPDIDVRAFNSKLKTLEIIDVLEEDWDNGEAVGIYRNDKNIIEMREGYSDNIKVFFHELVHCVRISRITTTDVELNIDYRKHIYGDAFNEAFTEMTADYLISGRGAEYFSNMDRYFNAYNIYAQSLFQIMKLVGEEYTLYDFFDKDVTEFENVLKKYGLEDLIILYDVDKDSNAIREIFVDDRSRIEELEGRLLELRVEQEIENDTAIFKIYELIDSFDLKNKTNLFKMINTKIKNNNNWEYCYTDYSMCVTYEEMRDGQIQNVKQQNPNIKIFDNGMIIYEGNMYEQNNFESKFYVLTVSNGSLLEYKITNLKDGKYIDVLTDKEITTYYPKVPLDCCLDDFYNCEININCFLKSELLNNVMSDINSMLDYLIELKNNGASKDEIYAMSQNFFSEEWLEIANYVLEIKDFRTEDLHINDETDTKKLSK